MTALLYFLLAVIFLVTAYEAYRDELTGTETPAWAEQPGRKERNRR